MSYEITESGKTLRLYFRPKTLRQRASPQGPPMTKKTRRHHTPTRKSSSCARYPGAVMSVRILLAAATMVATACARDGDASSSFSDGTRPETGASSGSSTSASSSTSGEAGESSSSGETSSGASTDSGDASSSVSSVPPDLGSPGPAGCQGKIDFLFVISNYGGMTSVQTRMHAALPEFIAAIEGNFAEFDRHVMVVETDESWFMKDCSLCGPGCDPNGELPTCGAVLDACDSSMGAGVTFPAGKDSSARRCELAAGRYITRDDPDPVAAFLCTARVGSDGGIDLPADAMVAALSPELLGLPPYPPTGCNQGFLRDDALLVVTLINDHADGDSSGPAAAWRDALMDAKHQDGDAFQLLVISTDNDVHDGECGEWNGGFTHRLREFTEIVPHGMFGSICAESYGSFFDLATDEILERCVSFIPQ